MVSVESGGMPFPSSPDRDRPWVVRTDAGHCSPAASNALYRRDTGLGQTGYDPDDELAAGEVGTAGTTQKDIKEYLSRSTRPR